jgi:hypothetical protein
MALPTTGPISFLQLFKEKFFRDASYQTPPNGVDNISLTEMTVGTGFFPSKNLNIEPFVKGVNIFSTDRPDSSQPYAMSEFRGYNEDAIGTLVRTYYDSFKRQGYLAIASFYNKDILIPVYEDAPFDFDGPEFNGYSVWRQVDITVDEFRNGYIRPQVVFKQNGAGEFRNDIAVSGQWIFLDEGKAPILGENGEYIRWEIKPNYFYSASVEKAISQNPFTPPENPDSVIEWKPILFDDDIVVPPDVNGKWSIDAEGTPTSETGPNEEIIYFLGSIYPKIWYESVDDRNEYPALDIYSNRTKYLFYESSGVSTAPTYNWMRWNRFLQVPSNASYLTFCYHGFSSAPETFEDDYLQVYFDAGPTDPTPVTTFTQIAFKLGIRLYSGPDATQNSDEYVGGNWRAIYYDLTANDFNAGTNIRPYVVFNQSNVDLRNDVGISEEWVFLDENFNEIEGPMWQDSDLYIPSASERFWRDNAQRSFQFVSGSTRENPEDVYVWHDIPFGDFNSNRIDLKWNKDLGSTPTSGTGPDFGVSYSGNEWVGGSSTVYYYYEASGSGYSVPVREWFRWKNFRKIPSGAKYLTFCYNAYSEDGETDYLNDYLKVFLESDGGITPPPINFS